MFTISQFLTTFKNELSIGDCNAITGRVENYLPRFSVNFLISRTREIIKRVTAVNFQPNCTGSVLVGRLVFALISKASDYGVVTADKAKPSYLAMTSQNAINTFKEQLPNSLRHIMGFQTFNFFSTDF